MLLGDVSREACNGLMRLPDRGRTLRLAFEDVQRRSDGSSLPIGEFTLASGARYRVEANDLAPHGIASMYKAAAVIFCAGGYLAIRLVHRLGALQLDGFEAGPGRGPMRLVRVA